MKSLFGSLFQDHSDDKDESLPKDENSQPGPQDTQALDKNITSHSDDSSAINPIKQHDIEALSHLDERSTKVLAQAFKEAKNIKQPLIEPEQLFLGLLSDREVFKLLEDFKVDLAKLTRQLEEKQVEGNFSGDPTLGEDTKKILEEAYLSSKKRDVEFISPEDILLVMVNIDLEVSRKLKEQGVEKQKIEEHLNKSPEYKTGQKSVLAQYGMDLIEQAKEGKLDPVVGRDSEIQRLIHILLRRTKNNPVIIGEAGVGKTALVEGLAQLIADGKVSQELIKKRIIQLDVSSLIAGASHRGEFEERLQNVIKEAMASEGTIILFIDEIHTLIGAGDTGGSMDASNIIKPYLTRGQLQVIGTTTTAEYRKNFEKDRAFERRFQPILCDEPTEEVATQMIKILQPKYEKYHNVTYSEEAIKAAVHLSKRYIGERFLPDKAIDLMDEAAAEVKLLQGSGKRGDNQVKDTDIQNVVSRWTGVPVSKLTEKEGEKLLKLEELIHKKFVDHDRAVTAVSEAVRRGRIGLASANRPIASFVFLGPTGTGKTELAKVLAEIMFGKPEAMIRLDMSEYMEKHEVAKLVGAPPGYVGYEEGGQLTEAVRTKPYSIVLLDEIEKAHPDVFNILLQLLEDGRLTDNKGNTVSFKNTVVICTSNIASDLIRQKLSEGQATGSAASIAVPEDEKQPSMEGSAQPGQSNTNTTSKDQASATSQSTDQSVKPDEGPPATKDTSQGSYAQLSKIVMEQLTKHFRPELINRFDEVVVFEPLTQENMMDICKLAIESTKKMLKEQNVDLQVSQTATAQLAKEGYDPAYGARPLRRLIQRTIENPLAIYLINRSLVAGDTVLIDYDSSQDKFVFKKVASNPVSANGQQTQQADNQTSNPQVPPDPTPPPTDNAGVAIDPNNQQTTDSAS